MNDGLRVEKSRTNHTAQAWVEESATAFPCDYLSPSELICRGGNLSLHEREI